MVHFAGAAAGAGGAGIYFTGVGESLRYVLDQGMGFSRGSGGGSVSDQQYQELLRMVQNMSTEMSRRQQGITILHSNESRCARGQSGHGTPMLY